MTCCAEVRRELVAVLRGEVSADVAAAVELHLSQCAHCVAERAGLLQTMTLVRAHVHPERSADARLGLSDALDREFAAQRPTFARRLVPALLTVPAALAAGVVAAWFAAPSASLAPAAETAPSVHDVRPLVSGALGTKSSAAASRGLAWIAARQCSDGTWRAAADADPETTAAVTATAVLAFAADGQTPARGPNCAALARAVSRLELLVTAGFSAESDAKPLYAQALGVRALAATYALDRDRISPADRRQRRDALAAAGRRLVRWQGHDGGFGYVPDAPRSDSSCTLFAVAALVELRRAGVLDAAGAMSRASSYLDTLRSNDGALAYSHPGDRGSGRALAAALLAMDGAFGTQRPPVQPGALASIEDAMSGGGDALLAWTGAQALARHGRPLDAPVRTLLAAQREDGAWTASADRRCASAGDTVTTAFGVLALAQAYAR